MRLNSKLSMISPFIVMDIMQKAAQREQQGLSVYHMEVGQPSFPAPPKVIAAARAALDEQKIGYTTALGLDALRQKISQHYLDFYSIQVPWSQIIITTGVSAGLMLAMLACFSPGEAIGVPVPGYPCYQNKINSLNLKAVNIHTQEKNDFLPVPEDLENLQEPIKGLILTSPSNPTGSILSQQKLISLIKYCEKKGIRVLSDEIYQGITFESFAPTAWGLGESLVVMNGFSKYFSMTGWRLGWMIVPETLVRPIEMLSQNFFMSPPTLSQFAAIQAFEDYELLQERVNFYRDNRDILLGGLKTLGFQNIIQPKGAFYVYVKADHLTNDSLHFCVDLLEKTGLAITPGLDFDRKSGHQWIRFSYARDRETVQKGLESLNTYLNITNASRHQDVA